MNPATILCSATYQLAGPGRSRQRVVFDRRRIADCRAWLTEKLGAPAYFAEDEPTAEAEPVEVADPVGAAPEPAGQLVVAEPSEPIAAEPRAPRRCDWIVDTTGDTIRRCGETIDDGRDLCLAHREHRARRVVPLIDVRELMPPAPLQVRPCVGLARGTAFAAAVSARSNYLADVLIPLGTASDDEVFVISGLGLLEPPAPQMRAAG